MALLLLAAAGTPAQAQTVETLVSNTGISSSVSSDHIFAQAFTTGAHENGYTLASVGINLRNITGLLTNSAGYRVRILSDSSGSPGDEVETLINPSSFANGLNTFTVPTGKTIPLSKGTTYWVEAAQTDGTGGLPRHTTTSQNGESGASGWSIADGRLWRAATTDSWSTSVASARLQIRGSANTMPPPDTPVVGPIGDTEIWSATLTVGSSQGSNGFVAGQYGSLSDTTFDHRGTSYTIDDITDGAGDGRVLDFSTTADHPSSDTAHLTLYVGTTAFAFSDARYIDAGHSYRWSQHQLGSWLGTGTQALRLVSSKPGPSASFAITSSPAIETTYRLHETIEVTATFNEAVRLSGHAIASLWIDGSWRGAHYDRGSGTRRLVFRYVVRAGDVDDNGVKIGNDALAIRSDPSKGVNGGGTIVGVASGFAADLANPESGDLGGHKVNGASRSVRGAPTDLEANAVSNSRIGLSWTAPVTVSTSAVTGYRIEISDDAGATWSTLVADTRSTVTAYSHTGLAANTTRHYRVSAINDVGTGPRSNVDGATTLASDRGDDFTAPVLLPLPANSESASATVTIRDDRQVEGTERIEVTASHGDAEIGDAALEIADADTYGVALAVDPARLPAGETGEVRVTATVLAHPVTASGGCIVPSLITLELALSGSAAADDYSIESGNLPVRVAACQDSAVFTLRIAVADGVSERLVFEPSLTDAPITLLETATLVLSDGNTAPAFPDAVPTQSVAENAAPGTDIGNPVTATDADGDILRYGLEGEDAASFDIDAATGQIGTRPGVTYDREAQPSYAVTVTVSDGFGGSDSTAVSIGVVERTGITLVDAEGRALANPPRLTVVEGGSAIFGFKLNTRPAHTVWVGFSHGEGDGDLESLLPTVWTVSPDEWETPVWVTVNARADDDAENGERIFETFANSDDPEYSVVNSGPAEYENPAAREANFIGRLTIPDLIAVEADTEASATATATVPLTAALEGVPSEHDGESAFAFELRFSEEVGLSYVTVRDALFAVTGGRVTGARRLARPSNRRWEVTVEPDSGAEVAISLAPGRACDEPGAVCTADGRALSTGVATVVRGPGAEREQPPEAAALTVSFSGMPPEHDGSSAFAFEFAFSEDVAGLSYVTVRDAMFAVSGGRVTGARRLARPSNRRWEVTVAPGSWADVGISLAAGRACDESRARCNANALAATVPGPAALSVADAEVHEAADAVLAFRVTLDRARHAEVTVDYATADGTATAGADYTPANGTLTFAAGVTAKTVSVAVLDDAHDEGDETLTLTLSNAQGARIADGTATGTIENTDHMPQAWLARFGRTVTGQVLDAVEARLTAPREAGARATLAGQALPSWDGANDRAKTAANPGSGSGAGDDADASERALRGDARDRDAMASIRDWMAHAGANGDWHTPGEGPEDRGQSRALTGRDLVTGTSFALTGGSAEAGGYAALWGRGAITRFDGRAGDLSLDGEVTTALMGADWAAAPGSGSGAGRWTAGLAMGHARGTGGYREGGACTGENCAGEVEATLTGLWPYAGVTLTDRLSAWAAAGYGAGELRLTPGGGSPFTTDLAMTMGAAGLRSQVLTPPPEGGLALAVKGDARFTRTASKAARDAKGGKLAAATADVWLVRSGIEGSRRFALGGDGAGMVLTPIRHLRA